MEQQNAETVEIDGLTLTKAEERLCIQCAPDADDGQIGCAIMAALVLSVPLYYLGAHLLAGAPGGEIFVNGTPLADLPLGQQRSVKGIFWFFEACVFVFFAASLVLYGFVPLVQPFFRAPDDYTLDRRDGRFLRGHREVCPLDQIARIEIHREDDRLTDRISLVFKQPVPDGPSREELADRESRDERFLGVWGPRLAYAGGVGLVLYSSAVAGAWSSYALVGGFVVGSVLLGFVIHVIGEGIVKLRRAIRRGDGRHRERISPSGDRLRITSVSHPSDRERIAREFADFLGVEIVRVEDAARSAC